MKREDILGPFTFRHACKEFDRERKIAEEDFNLILEVARLSPSSFGFEPWLFLVVQKPEMREHLKLGAWGATLKLDTASHFIICLCRRGDMKYDSSYITYMINQVQQLPEYAAVMKRDFYKAFQEFDFDLTDERKLFDWAARQCYIALGNMMTAAAMMNIDSCPIEGFNVEQTNHILSTKFGINTHEFGVVYMVAFGYRTSEPSIKTRKQMKEIVQIL